MSENPLLAVCQNLERISHGVQTQLSQFAAAGFGFLGINNNNNNNNNYKNNNNNNNYKNNNNDYKTLDHNTTDNSSSSILLLHPDHQTINQRNKATPVSKEELGRATWTFLHTLGAQYPDKPTRQQRRDVKELMEILSRMYPCKDCADHFKEILRSNPVQAGSQAEFSQWLCHVHNVVNRSLGKVSFQCERVDARWGKLECEQRACDLQGTSTITTSFGHF